MKREHASKIGAKSAPSAAVEGQPDQGVSGVRPEEKVDLREAVVGEYRFQGELIRAFYANGRTWFVAAEVCAVLDLANPRQAVKALRASQKGVSILDTLGGAQTVNLINESALYVLIFKSRKPQAEAFQTWVTDEVLPQIRRSGSYSVDGQPSQDGSVVLPIPAELARFVVVTAPRRTPHIRRTGIGEIVTEFTGLDRQAMCYTLKQIEVWWNKVQIKESPSFFQDEGFAIHKLDAAIREGSEMADHFLHAPVRNGLTPQARDS
ncbi:BRO-N domain-containing protein [Acidisoma silvae]|uniref:Bro-N domain-containing protein n=1 Tax=Acidisoma silvae TaxID=2802396 RepID=A0A963YVD0_9PROT|nr:Bro-N domain-containing protein [Acidisoma silvae]MCB8877464.1 Bro-N domain-containing protein [Acidisoma silvae]